MQDSVVITGMGVISPIGCDEHSFWQSLCQGRSGASEVEGLNTSELTRKIACQVREEVDVGRVPLPSEAVLFPGAMERAATPKADPSPTLRSESKDGAPAPVGRAAKLAVAAARQAMADAGLAPPTCEKVGYPESKTGDRSAVIVGTTMGETEFIEERLSSHDSDWLSPEHLQRIIAGKPGTISRHVQADLVGAGQAFDLYGACAAGNMAIAAARRSLLEGRCDVALAGGADGFSHLAFLGFMRLRVMAEEVCRPFDQKRDGLLVGEGAAMFVLERESTAAARGATVRAQVKGCGLTCEDYHPTRPHPEGNGLDRATTTSLKDAGLEPDDIDYICAHGTGTPQNDMIEVKMMQRRFPQGVPFSSIKALTGHTMGAASAMELAACVLTLLHQTLIPTWHLEDPIPHEPLDAVQGGMRPAPIRNVLNNSAGFGGYNSSVILSR